jgi:hypothetical protein
MAKLQSNPSESAKLTASEQISIPENNSLPRRLSGVKEAAAKHSGEPRQLSRIGLHQRSCPKAFWRGAGRFQIFMLYL